MMMMDSSSSSSSSRRSRYYSPLFTGAQWEELQQQALIYKYMASGLPVPPHLLLSLTSTPPTLPNYPHQPPTLSYEYNQVYQMGGNGRKIDLEPGRCRRTDGKKWRCSKEAYPDSKYCQRHMHRGRNRSRKPVEFSSSSSNSHPLLSCANYQNTLLHPSQYSSSSSGPFALSSTNNTLSHTNFIHSSSSKDYRYMEGVKDEDRSTYFNFQNLCTNNSKHQFLMGTADDIKSTQESNVQSNEQQPFHHFFSHSNTTPVDSTWPEVDPSKSPLSTQDLFQSKPTPYW